MQICLYLIELKHTTLRSQPSFEYKYLSIIKSYYNGKLDISFIGKQTADNKKIQFVKVPVCNHSEDSYHGIVILNLNFNITLFYFFLIYLWK